MATQYQMTLAAPVIWLWVVSPKPENVQQKIPSSYQATFLLTPDHPDFAPINSICGELAMAAFGTYEGKKFPVTDGTALADAARRMTPPKDREFLRGKILLATHAKVKKMDGTLANPPRLIVYNKASGKYDRFEERQMAQRMFYSGVNCIAQIAFDTYTGFGGGVTAYLNEIVSFNIGDKIITGVDDNERLGDASKYVGHVSAGPVVAGAHPTVAPHPAAGPMTGHVGTTSPINPMAAGPLAGYV